MDTHTATIAAGLDQGSDAAAGGKRSFLFLQGPISNFFDQLGRALIARGHRVHRINLHFGDQLFWRLPATHYRGRFEDWRAFIANALEEHDRAALEFNAPPHGLYFVEAVYPESAANR